MSEKLEIIPELRDLIPPLKDYELDQLQRSLDAHQGALDALIVWKERNAILDGHNRYSWCVEHGYDFTVRRVSMKDIEQAKRFIILNQLGRRNVDDKTAALLRGQLHVSEKKEPATTLKKGDEPPQCNSCTSGDTADRIAKMTGVSRRTVLNDAKFAQAADELGITADIVAGKDKRSRKEIVAAAEAKKPKKPRRPRTPEEEEAFYFKREKEAKPGPYRPRNGLQFARMALLDLEQITADDLERDQAFAEVRDWLDEHAPVVAAVDGRTP